MKMFKFYTLLVSNLILYAAPTAIGIECYSCDSIDDDSCEDPYNITLYTPIRCENDNFHCVKQEKINKELNRTYLHRGCIQKHYCEILAKAADFCITCTTDLCNSSYLMTSTPYFIITVILNLVVANYCL